MLNNDEIIRDIGDVENVEKAEDIRDRRNGNTRDIGSIGDIRDKEISSSNEEETRRTLRLTIMKKVTVETGRPTN